MRYSSAVLVVAAAGGTAQNLTTSTSIVYYDDCSTIASGAKVTATDLVTYCPVCEEAGFKTFPGGSYTTYVTEMLAECETGPPTPTAYTVTEPCPSSGLHREAPGYIPQGYITTTVPCGCKENTPVPITTPGPALQSASAKVAPAANPAVATGAPAAPGSAAPASGGSLPAPAEAPASVGSSPVPAEAPATGGSPAEAAAVAAPASGGSSPAEAAAEAPAVAGSTLPPYPVPASEGKIAFPSGSGAPLSNASSVEAFQGLASQLESTMAAMTALIMMISAFAFAL
ncbi:hypothetical protein MMC21_004115 [Puttea exsequens]|nr:hypothetical protein [Puttea exsequens]